ncbi:MAG: Na/Pi cotransporter family protein [Clostridiales bacterium]|nr:Na/Pi cotransporter family protein [Clostridiales bacterium]
MGIANILTLAGGMGLFLLGMKLMSEGLETAAGTRLKRMLEVLTSRKLLGMLVGAGTTAVIQSSSATTVMVIGFVNAGLITLSQAAGVIMGANIGTTVTGLLVALNPKDIAPAALLVGVVAMTFIKKKAAQYAGQIFAGLGLLFLGLNAMSSAMEPLRSFPPFIDMMVAFANNPLLGVLAGMVFTAVVQSSSASIGILQALAMQGAVPDIRAAVFILMGMNIGTCVTAILAALGGGRNAKRAAVIHLLFNVIGTAVFVAVCLLLPFPRLLDMLPGGMPTQIAAAHIVFNVATTLLLLPFSRLLVQLAQRIIPGRDENLGEPALEYLDPRILNAPPVAAAQVQREVGRMADLAGENLRTAMDALIERSAAKAEQVYEQEKLLNFLNHSITSYLVKINGLELQEKDQAMIGSLFHVVNDLERIGDHAENIADDAVSCVEAGMQLSAQAAEELADMFEKTMRVYNMAVEHFKTRKLTVQTVEEIKTGEEEIDRLSKRLEQNHVDRLNQHQCTPEIGMVFVNVVANLERVSDHATNVAYSLASPSSSQAEARRAMAQV